MNKHERLALREVIWPARRKFQEKNRNDFMEFREAVENTPKPKFNFTMGMK